MYNLKGRYDWKLVDKDSGNVDKEGSQWNTVTDALLAVMCSPTSWGVSPQGFQYNRYKLFASDSTATPGVEYRRFGASNYFNVPTGYSTAYSLGTSTYALGSRTIKTPGSGFVPPVSPVTIRIIGIGAFYNSGTTPKPNFCSYIVLSSPITQNTNQYLYIEYTLYVSYTSGGYNTPGNRYQDRGFSLAAITGGPMLFGWGYAIGYAGSEMNVTGLLPPVNINNVMREVPSLLTSYDNNNISSDQTYNIGSVLANTMSRSLATTDIPGPIGALCYSNTFDNDYAGYYWYLHSTYGYTPDKSAAPSISRVFVHSAARIAQVFSDPGDAPSQGAMILSGTPTQSYPMVGRVKITKTGDASDVVDDTFTISGPPTDTLTTATDQSHAVDDLVRFTTTTTLPSPLSTGSIYYVVYKSGTSMKVSGTLSGSPISITDSGTGTHTVIRWNTGKYSYEAEPWQFPQKPTLGYAWWNLNMGIDADNKVQPHSLFSATDTGEGGTPSSTPAFLPGSTLIRGMAKIDSSVYSVQRSRVSLTHNMCSWQFNTIETSIAQCSFGSTSTVINRVESDGTKVYVATNEGIYKYDTLAPTVSPTVMSITGLLDSTVKDIAYDPVTGYLWSGHGTFSSFTADTGTEILTLDTTQNIATGVPVRFTTTGTLPSPFSATTTYYGINVDASQIRVATSYANALINSYIDITTVGSGINRVFVVGLCKINLGTNTATRYVPGAGEQLQDMSSFDAYILPGQLDAYNGRIAKVGGWYEPNRVYNSLTYFQNAWVLDDGIGWYVFANTTNSIGTIGALRRGTNQIAFNSSALASLYRVTVTGLGTGTVVTDETFTGTYLSYTQGQMAQYTTDSFVWISNRASDYATISTYKIGSGVTYSDLVYQSWLGLNPTQTGWWFSQGRNVLDVDGSGNYINLWNGILLTPTQGSPSQYGYTGGNWVRGDSTDIYIKKTGTQALLNGVSAAFNNAVGKPYDQQFILGERFTFVYAPMRIKDNLQTTTVKTRFYYCNAAVHSLRAFTIPSSAPYTHHIDETSNPNFRNMDNVDFITEVIDASNIRYSVYTLPAGNTFTVVPATDILTVGTNIPTGTPVQISTTASYLYWPPWPLLPDAVYYAINVNTVSIKLANTYGDATAGTAIDIVDTGNGTHTIKQVAPTTHTYYAGINGVFVLSSTDATTALTLTYTYTLYT